MWSFSEDGTDALMGKFEEIIQEMVSDISFECYDEVDMAIRSTLNAFEYDDILNGNRLIQTFGDDSIWDWRQNIFPKLCDILEDSKSHLRQD